MSVDTAVLAVDIQQSFLHSPCWRDDDVPVFRDAVLRLLHGAGERGWPVVRILHQENNDGPSSPATDVWFVLTPASSEAQHGACIALGFASLS
jgi:hypothetical protein